MKYHPLTAPLLAALLAAAPLPRAHAEEPPPATRPADPIPPASALREVPFEQVRIDDAFWTPRLEITQSVTLPDLFDLAENQGKLDNFRIVAGTKEGTIRLYNAPDSDVYKLIEAAAYTLAWRDDPALSERLDAIIADVAGAQQPDGYLNTQYTLPFGHPASPPEDARHARVFGYGPDWRWKSTLQTWPKAYSQLYVAGHLFEAAAAHFRATGRRNLLDVAIKNADHLYGVFPPGEPFEYADHPQVGIGLMRLYEVTGDERYLRLAEHLVDGAVFARPVDLGEGANRQPLVEQRVAWGHAVRVNYIYAAATDVARHRGKPEMRAALDSLWGSIVGSRIYVHGGVGGPAKAEQLAQPFVLDPVNTYSETCANIATGQWNHALNLMTGATRYADVVEIEAFNGALAGTSLDGERFFYANKLAVPAERRHDKHHGVREHYLFCCPAKAPGFTAGIGRWLYATDDDTAFLNLPVAGGAEVTLADAAVSLDVATEYPWDGQVSVTVNVAEPAAFGVALRVPEWATGPAHLPGGLYDFADVEPVRVAVEVNGEPAQATMEDGYLTAQRTWQPGDTVTFDVPMRVRRVRTSEEVAATAGHVALMRGPVLYCIEGVDHNFDVRRLVLPPDAEVASERRPDLLGGVVVLRGRGTVDGEAVEFTAVPYFAWQNRGIAAMTTFLPETEAALENGAGQMDAEDADTRG